MKKFISGIALISIVAAPLFSQSQSGIDKLESLESQSENKNANATLETDFGNTVFDKNANEALEINLGNRTVLIEETSNKTNISISKNESHRKNANRFRAHLGGIGIGYNGFLTDFWSTSLNPGEEYFDIKTAKWVAWNYTSPSINLGITRHLGFASALGLSLNNYHFSNNNNITKGANGVIAPLYPAQGIVYRKSKLHTAYLNIPVVLELQIPANGSSRNTVNISGGVVGGMRLWSKTKVIWNDGGKRKEKENGDFNLNLLRWGSTARVGYKWFQVYGVTYFTPMFEKGKGPELYPFEVGVAFTF